jgi:hypothetical protein
MLIARILHDRLVRTSAHTTACIHQAIASFHEMSRDKRNQTPTTPQQARQL